MEGIMGWTGKLSRRETVLGGALTLLCGGCACAASSEGHESFGCILEPERAAPLLTGSVEPSAFFESNREEFIASSGSRDFDFALAQTLSRLTDVFGVLPGFSFYDDADGANAYATTATKLKRADGSVLFGKRHFTRKMREVEHPEVNVIATCAHEFGHIVQFKYGISKRLMAGQTTVRRVELHADFLAGYFAGFRKREKPDFPAAVFATSRHAAGDYSTHKKSHHGTPDERAAAVVRGFETAYRERRSFSDALGIGINYVERV
jgi:hypothetical protein